MGKEHSQQVGSALVERIHPLLGETASGRASSRVIVYNNFNPYATSVLVFMFGEADAEPFAVAKLCRDKSRLRNEYENLQRARRMIADSAPLPLVFTELDEFGVLCTQAVRARRVSGLARQMKLLGVVTDKLIALHGAARVDYENADLTAERLLAPFVAFARTEPDSELSRRYAEIGCSLAGHCAEICLPSLAQHGDFYFDNVLSDGGSVYFMDWEDYGVLDMPGYDLFCLLLDLQILPAAQSGLRRLARRRLMPMARKAVAAYFAAFDLPHQVAEALLVFSMMHQYIQSKALGHSSSDKLRDRLKDYERQPEPFRGGLYDLLA